MAVKLSSWPIAIAATLVLANGTPMANAQAPGFTAPRSSAAEQFAGNFVAIPGVNGNQNLETRYLLPGIVPPTVPTDVTGPGGGLGYARNHTHYVLPPGVFPSPVPQVNVIVARDPRYSFTGRWAPFSSAGMGVAGAPHVISLGAVVATPVLATVGDAVTSKLGTTAQIDAASGIRSGMPLIMPTCNAAITQLCPDKLQLANGAVLVKATSAPVYVTVPLCGETATVRLSRNALALVSALDGRLLVSNLTDDARDSVMIYMTDRTRGDYGFTPVRIGYQVEVYPNAQPSALNEMVAYTVLNRIPLTNGLTVETMRLSYPRTLKRYNLTWSLPADDLRRVMKTAAAVSYMDYQRSWNGLTPYAP